MLKNNNDADQAVLSLYNNIFGPPISPRSLGDDLHVVFGGVARKPTAPVFSSAFAPQ